jgi:hypothetical protein
LLISLLTTESSRQTHYFDSVHQKSHKLSG